MRRELVPLLVATLIAAGMPARADDRYGIGRPATPAEIAGWNIDVMPDGTGLPPGHGSVSKGGRIFANSCASCHGADGKTGDGRPIPRLVGGPDLLKRSGAVHTVGNYWPYATTLFDYIRRAMPPNAPQSLAPDQVYAVSAFVLHLNGVVHDGTVLDQHNLAAIRMPNRDGFVPAEQAHGDAEVPR